MSNDQENTRNQTKFDPSQHLRSIKGQEYLEVKWRIAWFRSEYPDGSIETEHVTLTPNAAIFKATVKVSPDGQGSGMATAYGSETVDDFEDFIEKAETKSVGRALAMLGFGTQFASELDEGTKPDGQRNIADAPVRGSNATPPPWAGQDGEPPPSQEYDSPPQRSYQASPQNPPSRQGQYSQGTQGSPRNAGDMISEAQKRKILGYVARGEVNHENLATILRNVGEGANDVDSLTKRNASRVIDVIMEGLRQ